MWLAAQPTVHWLSPKLRHVQSNWQGTAIVQGGQSAPAAPVALGAVPSAHPLWSAGLTGGGQVIGGGDSNISEPLFHSPAKRCSIYGSDGW